VNAESHDILNGTMTIYRTLKAYRRQRAIEDQDWALILASLKRIEGACKTCYRNDSASKVIALRRVALRVAWSFLGRPYIWGGDDPLQGFDCSGFVIECLKSAGVLPRVGDWTAQGLWDRFEDCKVQDVEPGCLVFWKNEKGRVTHVEICIGNGLTIGSSGGGSHTLTGADAIKQNAYIKVRPIRDSHSLKGYLDPFLKAKEGGFK